MRTSFPVSSIRLVISDTKLSRIQLTKDKNFVLNLTELLPAIQTLSINLISDKEYAGILPIIEIGLRAKRNLPLIPMYLLLHPADHSRIKYSKPKNTTNTIS